VPNRPKNQSTTNASEVAQAEADAIRAGKGRATPSRREREAANRRPIVPADRKAARVADRERMRIERQKQQAGMAAGDERYLPARDRGVQRRYARDYVDARWSLGEFLIPVFVLLMLATFLPFPAATKETVSSYALIIVWAFFVLTVIDCFFMTSRMLRRLREKHGEPERGLRWYASMRAIQIRPMRTPKPQGPRGHFPE
jgi:hypothetical protein